MAERYADETCFVCGRYDCQCDIGESNTLNSLLVSPWVLLIIQASLSLNVNQVKDYTLAYAEELERQGEKNTSRRLKQSLDPTVNTNVIVPQ